MENSFYIADLIVKKINGTITDFEAEKLNDWVNESPENSDIYNNAISREYQLNKLEVYNLFNKDKVWSAIENEVSQPKTMHFSTRRILSYAAAILIPVLISGGLLYSYFSNKTQPTLATIDTIIQPGSQKAVLVLSHGGSMELDDADLPTDIHEGNVSIQKNNNSLVYSDAAVTSPQKELVYNELRTPRGGGYNLNLSDGTEVWLNAGSSLRFPVSFTDSTRQVYLEGEGYFEVSHNGKPFIVTTGSMDVRVLGTSFNVSAYPEDSEIKTTLVEGRVRIDYKGNDESKTVSKVLTPNKQALLNRYLAEITIEEVNVAHYTSWMQGKLEFDNETLDIVMKRLARWYDFEYEFENRQAESYHFSGRINNSESISTILEMLEMTTDVKFDLKKNMIVIK